MTDQPRRHLLPLLVGTLVALGVVGAALRGPVAVTDRLTPPGGGDLLEVPTVAVTATPEATASTTALEDMAADAVVNIPGWWLMLALLLIGAVLVAVAATFARRLLAQRTERSAAELAAPAGSSALVEPDAVQEALGAAAAQLRRQLPPRDAVVAAWITLEESAARHGVHRSPSQTPTEFVTALLPHSQDGAAAQELREVYLRARFSQRPVTEQDVALAADALERLRSAWSRT